MDTIHNLHGGNTKKFLEQYRNHSNTIIDFSVNTFPYPMPDEFTTHLQQFLSSIPKYPDINNSEFIETVATVEGIPPECVIPLNGSVQGMYSICSIPSINYIYSVEPTFIEYKIAATAYHKKWFPLQRSQLYKDLDTLKTIQPNSFIFLCNPNNPDGNVISARRINEIMELVSDHNCILIVDEAFIEFSPTESVIRLITQYDNLIVFRSLTKFFGLAGLRCGYLAAHPTIVDKIHTYIPPWSLNALSQKAGVWVLEHSSFFYQTGKQWLNDAANLMDCCSTLPYMKVYPSNTSYFLIQLQNIKLADRFQNQLAQKGIMVRNCGNYEGLDESFIRIGARDVESNLYLRETLESTEFQEVME